MSVLARLGVYAVGLVAVFVGAFLAGKWNGPVGFADDGGHHQEATPAAVQPTAAAETSGDSR